MPDTVDLSIFLNRLADPGKHARGLVGIPATWICSLLLQSKCTVKLSQSRGIVLPFSVTLRH